MLGRLWRADTGQVGGMLGRSGWGMLFTVPPLQTAAPTPGYSRYFLSHLRCKEVQGPRFSSCSHNLQTQLLVFIAAPSAPPACRCAGRRSDPTTKPSHSSQRILLTRTSGSIAKGTRNPFTAGTSCSCAAQSCCHRPPGLTPTDDPQSLPPPQQLDTRLHYKGFLFCFRHSR